MKKNNKNFLKFYARYSSLAMQMIVIMVGAAWGGHEVDNYLQWKFPVFTFILTILGVVMAVIYGVREIFNKKNKE